MTPGEFFGLVPADRRDALLHELCHHVMIFGETEMMSDELELLREDVAEYLEGLTPGEAILEEVEAIALSYRIVALFPAWLYPFVERDEIIRQVWGVICYSSSFAERESIGIESLQKFTERVEEASGTDKAVLAEAALLRWFEKREVSDSFR